MSKELTSSVLVKVPALNVTATGNSQNVDTQGFEQVCISIAGTTAAASTLDAKVQESADGSTGWADITGALITQVPASQTRAHQEINIPTAKRQRYLRVVFTIAGTVSASAHALLSRARYTPPTQDATPIVIAA